MRERDIAEASEWKRQLEAGKWNPQTAATILLSSSEAMALAYGGTAQAWDETKAEIRKAVEDGELVLGPNLRWVLGEEER